MIIIIIITVIIIINNTQLVLLKKNSAGLWLMKCIVYNLFKKRFKLLYMDVLF